MLGNEEHIELIERYRSDQLSDKKILEFHARLSYDSEFNASYQEYLKMEDGIKTHYRKELKLMLKEIDNELDEPKKSNSKAKKIILWGSSIAAAIALGVFIFQHYNTPNHQKLAQEYWPYEAGLPVKMSTKGKYDKAMNAFKTKDYAKAESLLETIDTDTSYYYRGVIAFEEKKYEEAIEHFDRVKENSSFFEESKFRIALSHLAEEDVKKAKAIFETLSKSKGEFQSSSKEILKKL